MKHEQLNDPFKGWICALSSRTNILWVALWPPLSDALNRSTNTFAKAPDDSLFTASPVVQVNCPRVSRCYFRLTENTHGSHWPLHYTNLMFERNIIRHLLNSFQHLDSLTSYSYFWLSHQLSLWSRAARVLSFLRYNSLQYLAHTSAR